MLLFDIYYQILKFVIYIMEICIGKRNDISFFGILLENLEYFRIHLRQSIYI